MTKINLEDIQKQLKNGKMIEEVIAGFDWKDFEKIVGEIFIKNEFLVKQNFRFKIKRRYEIDLIAARNNLVFVVDCKQWGKGRYKSSGIRKAANDQEIRADELKKFFKKNKIAQEILKIKSPSIFPLIITLWQEDVQKENNTFVVPIWKLNSFLLHFDIV